jgi:hypothetical protein
MGAVEVLPGHVVAGELRKRKCTRVAPIGDTAELWMTESGWCFTVPARGDDKMCPKKDLAEILDEIARR